MKCGTGHILESKSCGFWHTFLILIYVAATKSPIIASFISQYQDLNFSHCYKYKHFSKQSVALFRLNGVKEAKSVWWRGDDKLHTSPTQSEFFK